MCLLLSNVSNGVGVKWTNPFEMLEKEGALLVLAPNRRTIP